MRSRRLRVAETDGSYRYGSPGEREEGVDARPAHESAPPFPESTLVALWLLGRVPVAALPFPLLRPGRAGRGPGPDVREATFLLPSGVTLTGDVEVHLRASDFVRHGHAVDPAYAGVALHLCWVDDRIPAEQGLPTPLPVRPGPARVEGPAHVAPTVALAGVVAEADVERLVARGPAMETPCAFGPVSAFDAEGGAEGESDAMPANARHAQVRAEGRRRLAERTWRAWRLADRYGFDAAFRMLLERAVASTAGRLREDDATRQALVDGILSGLGAEPCGALAVRVIAGGPAPRDVIVQAVTGNGVGRARVLEIAWNAVLPVLGAVAAAYDDVALARATATMVEGWPAPRPYGRTRALASALGPPPRGAGALHAQGLLHLQDLWCTRGGCGVCPVSAG